MLNTTAASIYSQGGSVATETQGEESNPSESALSATRIVSSGSTCQCLVHSLSGLSLYLDSSKRALGQLRPGG